MVQRHLHGEEEEEKGQGGNKNNIIWLLRNDHADMGLNPRHACQWVGWVKYTSFPAVTF